MQRYNEIWKDIPNYEGLYQVSDLGRVRSFDRIDALGRLRRGRILKHSIVLGYNKLTLCGRDGSRKEIKVHRLVMLAFCGWSDLQVNHINGIKTDNRLENLEYVTNRENSIHAVEMGLIKKGEAARASKLTEIEAMEIKYSNKGLTQKEVAAKYGVDHTAVSRIRREKTWKHI